MIVINILNIYLVYIHPICLRFRALVDPPPVLTVIGIITIIIILHITTLILH